MKNDKPYYKVTMPGWWYYTQDPPSRWRVILCWCISVLFWPVALVLTIATLLIIFADKL